MVPGKSRLLKRSDYRISWHLHYSKNHEVRKPSDRLTRLIIYKFLFFLISDSELIAMNGRKENYSEMSPLEQQSAFYSYFNQASTMQLLAPQLFAHQTLMSSWPFHPTFFSGWPLSTPLPYTSPGAGFALSQQISETINNNYLSTKSNEEDCDVKIHMKNEAQRSSFSSYSGSISPASQMNDSVEIKKIEKKDATRSKTFECKVCNKTFGYKHVLQNHEKVHTGEKSYRCTKCSKCFRRDHHLKVHMRLHSGEKPYICNFPTCERQFVQVANLRRHMKTHENAGRLEVHEKLLKSEEKISLYASESSEDYLDMRKCSSTGKFDYSKFNASATARYESPEQSEPEDLSTKTFYDQKLLQLHA